MKPQSTKLSHIEVNRVESEEDLGRLRPSDPHSYANLEAVIDKLGSRSKVYLKSLIRDLDLELVAIIAMSPPTHPPTRKLFFADLH